MLFNKFKSEERSPKDDERTYQIVKNGIDRRFLIYLIVLVSMGSVMIFTASYPYAEAYQNGDTFYYAKRQMVFLSLGFTALAFISRFFTERFLKWLTPMILGFSVATNIYVIIKGTIGKGAQRWIDMGVFSVQPSEFLKFSAVLICAYYMERNQSRMRSIKYGFLPFVGIIAALSLLLILQSHLSATVICCAIVFFMMIIGGTSFKALGIIVGGVVGFATYVLTNLESVINWSIVKDKLAHTYLRLLVWQDPIKYMRDDVTGDAGWQPSQSLFAISAGGFWGLGLGQSIEKHGWLPEPQNDYIFSILCEEFGFFGAAVVICLFAALIIRGFKIANRCTSRFAQLFVSGIMCKLALQVILNIAVVTNTIPSTGISLPFFSYGGSALIMTLVEMGLVLCFSKTSLTPTDSSDEKDIVKDMIASEIESYVGPESDFNRKGE